MHLLNLVKYCKFSLLAMVLIPLAALSLPGCGEGEQGLRPLTTNSATITGGVAGTMIIAVDADDNVIKTVEATGTPGNKSFILDKLPLNKNLSLFLFSQGSLIPVLYSNGTKDAFQFTASTAVGLGFITIQANGTATPANTPTGVTLANGKRSIVPHKKIQTTLIPSQSLSVNELIEGGKAAVRNKWPVVANTYFQQAEINARGTSSHDETLILFALSKEAALSLNTAASGVNYTTVGDFLTAFGMTNTNMHLDKITSPATMPATSPTGADLINWFNTHMIPELVASVNLLNQITTSMTPITLAGIDTNGDGLISIDEPMGRWIDSNTNGVANSGEIGASTTWTTGTHRKTEEIDYADIQVFKAILHYQLGQLYINRAYDWNVDIDATNALTTDADRLSANPNAGTMGSGYATNLATAKTYLTSAADFLLTAITSIEAETDSQTDDFITLNPTEIADSRTELNNFKSYLAGAATRIEGTRQLSLNLSKFFDGISLRAIIPPVTGDSWSGLFPDATMGGIFPTGAYNFAGENLNQDRYPANGIPDILDGDYGSIGYSTFISGNTMYIFPWVNDKRNSLSSSSLTFNGSTFPLTKTCFSSNGRLAWCNSSSITINTSLLPVTATLSLVQISPTTTSTFNFSITPTMTGWQDLY